MSNELLTGEEIDQMLAGIGKEKRPKLHGLDKYVIFSIAVVLIYTLAEFITATLTGIEKATLSTCVYGFFAGEIVTAGLIRIFKLRHEGEDGDVFTTDAGADSSDL